MGSKLIEIIVVLIFISFIDETSAGSDSSSEALCDFYNHLADDIIIAGYKSINETYNFTLTAIDDFNKTSHTLDVLLTIYSPWSNENYAVVNETIDEIADLLELSSDYVLGAIVNNNVEESYPLTCIFHHLRHLYFTFFTYVNSLDGKANLLIDEHIKKIKKNRKHHRKN